MGENNPVHAGIQDRPSARDGLHVYSRSLCISIRIPVRYCNTYLIPACLPALQSVFHGHARFRRSGRKQMRLPKILPLLLCLQSSAIRISIILHVHCVQPRAEAQTEYPDSRSDMNHQCALSPLKALLKDRKISQHGRAPDQRYSGRHQR